MFNRVIATLLVIFMSMKSFGFVLEFDHHSADDETHAYFHSVAQPHSHDVTDKDEKTDTPDSIAVIDYSESSIKHISSDLDTASVFVVSLTQSTSIDLVTDKANSIPLPDWQKPFLAQSPPPPKV